MEEVAMLSTSGNTVERLNSMLDGEIAAVQTYGQALDKIENPAVCQELERAQICHSHRVQALVAKIESIGGKPTKGAGPWVQFAKALEGGAKAFGDKAAVSMLEEGEDKGLADYKKLATKDDNPIVQGVAREFLPRQQETHDAMSNLKHRMQ
jgi:uncharacterized protein (TIGR02284 family)